MWQNSELILSIFFIFFSNEILSEDHECEIESFYRQTEVPGLESDPAWFQIETYVQCIDKCCQQEPGKKIQWRHTIKIFENILKEENFAEFRDFEINRKNFLSRNFFSEFSRSILLEFQLLRTMYDTTTIIRAICCYSRPSTKQLPHPHKPTIYKDKCSILCQNHPRLSKIFWSPPKKNQICRFFANFRQMYKNQYQYQYQTYVGTWTKLL